jgi:uncharacterized DUF497 family protein
MSSPRIESFLFDEENEDKIAAHGLSVRQVLQVLGNRHLVVRNRKERRGLYLILGQDDGGACIAIPVESTYEATVWRPITAWPCKLHERMVLDKNSRR